MNKKGFTLIELILVITLMAIISVLVIPNIMDSLSSSKDEKYKSMVKLVQKNMKYYNEKNEVDLWDGSTDKIIVDLDDIKGSGSELNLDDCSVDDEHPMTITRVEVGEEEINYQYDVCLYCNEKPYCSSGFKQP